jgi:N6-L-threonylcarbamoyladenine synthase
VRPFLAFDTATDHLALAVGDLDTPGAVLAAEDFPAPRAANTVVLPAAERLLARIGLQPSALAAVAVGRGPGSFTGVRIGVATAKGIAHGCGVPLVGFGTLDAIARRTAAEGLLGVLGDAMRGEVYPALFRAHAGLVQRLSIHRVAFPADVAAEWALLAEPIALTGGGLAKHRAAFESGLGLRARVLPESRWAPDGASLVAAAWAEVGEGSLRAVASRSAAEALAAAHPGAMLPVYTRLSDAEEAERLRAGGAYMLPHGGVAGPAEWTPQ